MKRFVQGQDRGQATLLPECLEDWIDEDNPVRVIDASSMHSILQRSDLRALSRQPQAGRAIIPRFS